MVAVMFLEPRLARCTISFFSPSCMPFNPAVAWNTAPILISYVRPTSFTKKLANVE